MPSKADPKGVYKLTAKRGPRTADDDRPLTQRVQIRLYPNDIEAIDALIESGYAENRSEVIRRSIAETFRWTIEAKR